MLRLKIAFMILAVCLLAPAKSEAAAGISIKIASHTVKPGDRQSFTVQDPTGSLQSVEVIMPDGDEVPLLKGKGRVMSWSFIQPAGVITRQSQTATIRLDLGTETLDSHYQIAFGAIDLVAPHGEVNEGSVNPIWVHTAARTHVILRSSVGAGLAAGGLRTGKNGWAKTTFSFSFVNDQAPFDPQDVTLTARALVGTKTVSARRTFAVQPFHFGVAFTDLEVLHQVTGVWTPTTIVRAGEELQITATAFMTEPAGTLPYCVAARITLTVPRVNPITVQMSCMQDRKESASVTVPTNTTAGSGQISVDGEFKNGSAHVVIPISVAVPFR